MWKVTIERLWKITPIEGADKIETAYVKGWQAVVPKGQFKEMDLVIFVPIDSIVPQIPYFAFMEKYHWRVHTLKMKGQISQGLVLNPKDFEKELLHDQHSTDSFNIMVEWLFNHKTDVSSQLAITKYEKIIPAQMNGVALRAIPMPPTDEPRIQENPDFFLAMLQKYDFEVTEKLDGTSITYYLDEQGHFGVCSRNYELVEDMTNTAWKYAKDHDIEGQMKRLHLVNIAIRGEMVGPKIGKNYLQLTAPEFFVFNIYDLQMHDYYLPFEREVIMKNLALKHVPINYHYYHKEPLTFFALNMEEILAFAMGNSTINRNVGREGVVFKCSTACPEGENNWCSFKVINNTYAAKNKD